MASPEAALVQERVFAAHTIPEFALESGKGLDMVSITEEGESNEIDSDIKAPLYSIKRHLAGSDNFSVNVVTFYYWQNCCCSRSYLTEFR